MNIIGKWKIAEAEMGDKSFPTDLSKDLILDLDETSYQIIVTTVVENGLLCVTLNRSNIKQKLTISYSNNGKV